MLSHDFANALLKRRNNDMRFVAEVCLPGTDDDGEITVTEMMDDRLRSIGATAATVADATEELITFDAEDDVLDVKLGPIFAGEHGSYLLSPEEVRLMLKALAPLRSSSPGAEPFLKLRKALQDATK